MVNNNDTLAPFLQTACIMIYLLTNSATSPPLAQQSHPSHSTHTHSHPPQVQVPPEGFYRPGQISNHPLSHRSSTHNTQHPGRNFEKTGTVPVNKGLSGSHPRRELRQLKVVVSAGSSKHRQARWGVEEYFSNM